MATQIGDLVSDRYVSPLGQERKNEILVNMVSNKEFSTLVKAGKNGQVSFRETRIGGCTKQGNCDYGGMESIARCAGGDGDRPCRDAIFDKAKKTSILKALEKSEERVESAKPNSPREMSLQAEVKGLRNYLNAISK
jgi:hypothetical protein